MYVGRPLVPFFTEEGGKDKVNEELKIVSR